MTDQPTADKNGIAQIDRPVRLLWRNRRVKTRENDNGVFFLVEMEIDEESWGFIKTMPRNSSGEMVLWMTEVGMVTEKKAKTVKPPTPYGNFWEVLLYQLHFYHCPGVKEVVQATIDVSVDIRKLTPDKQSHAAFRQIFGVEHLSTDVSPDQVIEKFPDGNAPSLVRNAEMIVAMAKARQEAK